VPTLSAARIARFAWIPYVLPFAVFLGFLALQDQIPIRPDVEMPLRLVILTAVLWLVSRDVIDLRSTQLLWSTLLGAAVFLLWIAPDALIPGYRNHILFQNSITGHLRNSVSESALMNPVVLWSRILRAVVLVPIIEELFWRAWLMRWIISPDFEKIPLGTYSAKAFWVVAVLFASEHGSYWEVGLVAGILYNWWMVKTKRLGDLILAHAVTNACLSAYVVFAGRWEYWG